MTKIRFAVFVEHNTDGKMIFVQPQHVVSIRPYAGSNNTTTISLVNDKTFVVKQSISDVVDELEAVGDNMVDQIT